MSHDRDTLRAVSWLEVFPGLHLFSSLRMAINPRMLVLAAIAMVGTSAGFRTVGAWFSGTADRGFLNQIEANNPWPWERDVVVPPVGQLFSADMWRDQSPLLHAWSTISAPFIQVYSPDGSVSQFAYWLVCALWSLALWAFFGGAITRIAAVGFARNENLAWGQVAGFVRPHWPSYFLAPLFPILGTFLVGAFLAVVGLLIRDELGQVGMLLGGILWPLVLLGGFAIAFLLIWLFFGWPLMWGAISAEGTDSFGAVSHSLSYTCQRPLRYLVYAVAAALIGVLGWYLVALFAHLMIEFSRWAVSWGSGTARIGAIALREDMGSVGNFGVELIHFWNNCVATLAMAFLYSYFWTASTVIYFLLRRSVDATELDEVYLPEEQELHGLPPLKTGADGVAEPADDSELENPSPRV